MEAAPEPAPAPATVGCLSRECLALVFAQLDPEDLAAAACASAAWARALATPELEAVWAAAGARAYLLAPGPGGSPAAGPDGALRATHRAAAAAWGPYFRRYGDLGRRAAAAWRALERWTAAHAPAVRASLRRGATEAELDAFEAALIAPYPRVRLAPALRALYAFHDGQELAFDRGLDARRPEMGPSAFHGLFGGYAFYSHVVSTRMLPLARALRWARALPASAGAEGLIFPFAASFNFAKIVFVHVESGVPCAATLDREALVPAVPAILHEEEGPDPHYDTAGALRWVEAYAAALEGGRFGVEHLVDGEPRSEGISLFPRTAPARSEASTRGVRIRAAALFVPEQSTLPPAWRFAAAAAGALARARPADAAAVPGAEGEGEAQFFFAYNVQMALLPEAEQEAAGGAGATGGPLCAAQLRARRWSIRDGNGGAPAEVTGEGVIGHFPLLAAGGPEFSYRSCTQQRAPRGAMAGGFAFVAGSLAAPTGAEFEAACAPFPLEVPEVFF